MAVYRILLSIHSDKNARLIKPVSFEENPELFDKEGNFSHQRESGDKKNPIVMFYPGDIIETEVDLSRHQLKNGPRRFELLPQYDTSNLPKREEDDDGLERMTIADLKTMAEAEEIDLGDASIKAEIINIIRVTQGQAVEA